VTHFEVDLGMCFKKLKKTTKQLGYSVSQPIFETGTYRLYVIHITH